MVKKGLIVLGVSLLTVVFFYWQNNGMTVQLYEVGGSVDEKITIVHLSDLHSKTFGEDNARLVKRVTEMAPDVVFITGDLVDQSDQTLTNQLIYIEKLVQLAPVYIVFGNHEYWAGLEEDVKVYVEDLGAVVLENEAVDITLNGHDIHLIGLSDVASGVDPMDVFPALVEEDAYTIVLYHQPLLLSFFAQYGVDMVFSGHAHGGQIRIPFVGGLFAPGEGFFPTYTSGLYKEEETVMVVSRGLGNSVIPLRMFNLPEIVVVRLK